MSRPDAQPPGDERSNAAQRCLQRLPFHLLTVGGGFCSAWILRHGLPPAAERSEAVDLLRYLPVLIGLSANVGVQSSTVLVRGLATGAIPAQAPWTALRREVGAGVLTGALGAALALLLVPWVEGRSEATRALSLALAAALLVALSWSALVGSLLTLGLRQLGRDPAVGAGPLAILIGDVSSVALYMGTAWLVREALA